MWLSGLGNIVGSIQFQSTHLHEVWHKKDWLNSGLTSFQSTHLHEVWLRLCTYLRALKCFNPHTYMRCDAIIPSISSFRNVSIHTPTWGVTPHYTNLGISGAFQSTHLHEVWPIGLVHLLIVGGFNPHTYMRCDSLNNLNWSILGCFNPHTYMRCDSVWWFYMWYYWCFNPHTYMRCDCRLV